jgi:hypothetical protein
MRLALAEWFHRGDRRFGDLFGAWYTLPPA